MGGKLSSGESSSLADRHDVDGHGLSGSVNALNHRHHRQHHHHHHHHRLSHQTPSPGTSNAASGSNAGARTRTRSHGGFSHHRGHPAHDGIHVSDSSGSPELDLERPRSRSLVATGPAGTLPLFFSLHGIKCPVCTKIVPPEDIECHLVMCFTKPRVVYNDDVLTEDKGECVICLDDLRQGDTIARLPCLCIYHKSCIDRWFKKNRSCPEHPGD